MFFTLLLVPLASYLLLYAPGRYLLRLLAPGAWSGSRVFREVLLSVCCTTWIGFVLAELGVYSLAALLSCSAGVTVIAALASRGVRSGTYGLGDLAGIVVALLTWLWLSPPLDTRILGADSAGYIAAGVHLSRHGTLVIHDPTLPLLPDMLKLFLFPSLSPDTPWAPPYLRLLGSLTIEDLTTDEVLPAFHHLMTVWVAIFHGVAGSAAAQWAITLFGGLSIWAMVEFAVVTCGWRPAAAFLALLSLSAVQSWYSRFLMPEIPAQFFLWSGLACTALWSRTQRRADAILAGLAFGLAGLMRTENAVFAFAALLFGLYGVEPRLRAQRFWLFGCALLLWGHAAVHLTVFRTHYAGILLSLPPQLASIFTGASVARLGVLLGGVAMMMAWLYRRRAGTSSSMLPVALTAACIALWGDWQQGWSSLGLLAAYTGAPTLIAGTLGLGLWMRQTTSGDAPRRVFGALVAVAVVQFLVAPHATPVPIWVVRRAATLVLPAFCLGAAFLCYSVARRWHWSVAALLFFMTIVGQVRPFAQLRWTPYYQGGLEHVRAVGDMVPANACLLYDAPLAAWGFAQGLWAERDLPAYLLSRFDGLRIIQVLQALDGVPVYWLAEGRAPIPQPIGFSLTRVGSYSFQVLTPTLDEKTPPGANNQWNSTVAVYAVKRVELPTGG